MSARPGLRRRRALLNHKLWPLMLALLPEPARAGLVAGLRDPDPANRHAAVKATGNMAYPARRALPSPSARIRMRRIAELLAARAEPSLHPTAAD